ncbi:TIGR03915 family putative DNA repair protein [Marinitoga lauensis]|uniref:TIGR03915 family putative DNA repair protein n=1 Tax=Marinitoga lauensis TaxID=2201189 RepID=UPI0010135A17|nr:TIGR03915 family putative DNA repair protein [Marinitoga lauensis]
MKIILYDGTFSGLLTIIFNAYNEKKIPDIIFRQHNPSIFNVIDTVKTDYKKATVVSDFITNKLDKIVLKNMYLAYLSEFENIEVDIIKYFNLSLKIKRNAELHIEKNYIIRLKNAITKVINEKHKFLGLLRFRKLSNGIWYAPFEPDHNIISLLPKHFINRYPDKRWIIHDIKRNLILAYDKKIELIQIKDFDNNFYLKEENLSYEEKAFQSLWKTYFKSASISERKNEKLQRQYMPIRYWKYLIEI